MVMKLARTEISFKTPTPVLSTAKMSLPIILFIRAQIEHVSKIDVIRDNKKMVKISAGFWSLLI